MFIMNYEYRYFIDTTPDAGSSTWSRLAKGLSSADPENNETLDQTPYLDGNGHGTTDVTGMQRTIAFSGHRELEDAAQNYISGLALKLGANRKTNFRQIDPEGNIIEKECTIANINPGGGDAGSKSDFGFEIHLNGEPVYTPKQGAPALSITVAAGSISDSTKFTATAGAGNSLAYSIDAAAKTDVTLYKVVSGLTAYTSGADIPDVVAGQFVNAYELDEYGTVAKFVSYELQSADIAA